MKDYYEDKIEYFEEISGINEEASYNRQNVDKIKKLIVSTFVVVCTVPVFFCLYLMVKMNRLDAQTEGMKDRVSALKQTEQIIHKTDSTIMDREDALLLEHEAIDDLEKGPGDATNVLMGSDELVEGGVDDITISGSVQDESSTVSDERTPTVESESVSVNSKHKIYLTFDDGPSTYTDDILDVLKENNVKATFFVVYTPNQELWPMYKRIVDEGHTLAMHSYTHVYEDIYASKEAFVNDVTAIHDFLYEQTGVDCKYYRFPGGSSNSVSKVDIQELMGYLYENGITYYDWNSLSEDAVDIYLTPEQLNDNVMSTVRTNTSDSIVLMHDLQDNPNTAEGLQDLINMLNEEGYKICPIDDNTIPVQHISYDME